jgi:hypothetical protein
MKKIYMTPEMVEVRVDLSMPLADSFALSMSETESSTETEKVGEEDFYVTLSRGSMWDDEE